MLCLLYVIHSLHSLTHSQDERYTYSKYIICFAGITKKMDECNFNLSSVCILFAPPFSVEGRQGRQGKKRKGQSPKKEGQLQKSASIQPLTRIC